MTTCSLHQKLKSIADDFTCGDWGSPRLLSPNEYVEQAQQDFNRHPGDLAQRRLETASDKWAFIFTGRRVPNARGLLGYSILEARAVFTAADVADMDPSEIRRVLISTLAEREVHQTLEWAQRKSSPGVPIVDPHETSDDLYDVVSKIANAILVHAQ